MGLRKRRGNYKLNETFYQEVKLKRRMENPGVQCKGEDSSNLNGASQNKPKSKADTLCSSLLSSISTDESTQSYTENSGHDSRKNDTLVKLLESLKSELEGVNLTHNQTVIENANRMLEMECQRKIDHIVDKATKLFDYFK
ncbi:hypothetical protein FG386_002276 [Cryptosporidium ryanae]|uniref:uncharacterized protein n=1 Tax=Cryptosporidium ryanae TaxID=515981 RepID=UPI00351A2790|nr:hypothetical protein FG386_002276 [Cryptosporidium ryanae]